MAEIINTFVKGMDKDTDKAYVSKDSYLDAHNLRLTTTKGSSTGSLETVLGNHWLEVDGAITSELFVQSDQQIVGAKELRDKLVIFTTNINHIDPRNPGAQLSNPRSQIHVAEIDLDSETITSIHTIYDDALNHAVGGAEDLLYFSSLHPIKAVSIAETTNLHKIYWTDGYNNIRTCNINDNLTTDGEIISYPTNMYISTDKLAFLSEFTMCKPEVTDITSGTINTGVVFYAYQLYYTYGAETVISPMSSAISVTASSDCLVDTKEYYGSNEMVSSGKGFEVHITGLSNGYDKLRLIRVHYATKDASPTISIAAEISISPDVDNVYVYDTGETIGELTLDEFNINKTGLFSCKDIAVKDNILFAANITEELFDIPDDFDCRAVRFNSTGTAEVYNSGSGTPVSLTTVTAADWVDDYPVDHDGINYYNNPDYDGDSSHEFKYQLTNNTKWGAEGPNLTIGFKIEEMVIDSSGDIYSSASNASINNDGGSYSSFANPITAGKACWQRDEIYRLYVVFNNTRGQKSFPRWICDLRMPGYFDTIIDDDGNEVEVGKIVYAGAGADVTAYLLYPTITIKNMPEGAVSAQVYRMERKKGDRSIITQGVSLPMTYNTESDVDCWGPAACMLENYDASFSRVFVKPDSGVNTYGNANIPSPITGPHTYLTLQGAARIVAQAAASDVSLSRIVSPELLYTNTADFTTANAYLEYVTDYSGYATGHLFGESYDNTTGETEHRNTGFYYVKGYNNNIVGARTTAIMAAVRKPISATEKVGFFDTSRKDIGAYTYRNYTGDILWSGAFNNTDMRYGSYGSTCLLVTTTSQHIDFQNTTLPIVNYKVKIFDSQYGGNTYATRVGDTSIPCSDLITAVDTQSILTGGDTFINYFEVLTDCFDLSTLQYAANGGYATWATSLQIPIESSINLELNSSRAQLRRRLTKETGVFDPSHAKMTQEVAGDYWIYYDHDVRYSYNQTDNLYVYNQVYSQSAIAQATMSRNPDKELENTFDTRILASAKKINGEMSDSWTKFGVNDFIEVNGTYGPINAITHFDNKLFYFQDQAVGIASVNAQSLIQDNNSAQLVLGTGGVLSRFDHVSTHAGSMDKFSVVSSKAGLYWFDRLQKTIFRYSEGLSPLSKVNSIQSYLYNTNAVGLESAEWDGTTRRVVLAHVDNQFDEVLFSFQYYAADSVNNVFETLVFNETADCFTAFYDFVPYLYVPFKHRFLTTPSYVYWENGTAHGSHNKLFIHNSTFVPRASFYDSDYSLYGGDDPDGAVAIVPDASIKLLFNPEYSSTKAFDNLYYVSNTYYQGNYGEKEQFENTFDVVRFYDDYQNTDYLELVTPSGSFQNNYNLYIPIERRERGWSLAIPRSVVSTDVSDNADIFDATNFTYTHLFKERMRDKYLIVDLIYNNSKNTAIDTRFNVNHIGLVYRTSKR